MTLPYSYVGCDISKHHLDFYDPAHSKSWRIANDPQAIAEQITAFADASATFVVMEATGSYDKQLRHALAAADMPYCRVNPMMARRFGEARGQRAKTDVLDARLLADLGTLFELHPDPRPCPVRERLTALRRRRDQLVAMRSAEQVRLQEADDPVIQSCLEETISFLNTKIKAMDTAIDALIEEDQTLAAQAQLLVTAPGVGTVTAATLLALLPELGNTSPKRIASLAGLAPFNHDSGLLKGRRCIAGGRALVRKALYMAALSAARSSPRLKAFYQALAQRAGSKKLALIAVARKLLTCLNAMIRDQKQWT